MGVLFGGGSVVLTAALELSPHYSIFVLGLFAIFVVIMFALAIYAHRFRCPRCGNYYTSNLKGIWLPPFCSHCGLPWNSSPTTAVSPLFRPKNSN